MCDIGARSHHVNLRAGEKLPSYRDARDCASVLTRACPGPAGLARKSPGRVTVKVLGRLGYFVRRPGVSARVVASWCRRRAGRLTGKI